MDAVTSTGAGRHRRGPNPDPNPTQGPRLTLRDVHLGFVDRRRASGGRRRDQLRRVAGAQEKRQVTALDGVDLTVRAGEVVALVGPSESGVTTVLRVAAGVLTPDAGQVTYPPDRLAWFSGARMTDNALSLRQNVDLLVGLLGRPAVSDPAFASTCAAAVDLTDAINAPMASLPTSSGARLGLVVALSLPAPLFVLDGPLDAGTKPFRTQVRQLIERAAADGSAVVLSAERPSTLLGLATRGVRMRRGRVAADGDPQVILTKRMGGGKKRAEPKRRRDHDDDDDEDSYG